MANSVFVHLLPDLFQPEQLTGGIAVIIDILRASTTMITALHHGAAAVVPWGTVEQAMHIRQTSGPETRVLLGGERGGVRIEGFDLGNSPADYTTDVVDSRILGFTTTNGTRALLRSVQADQIVVGAFVNLSVLITHLRRKNRPVHLVCAGTDGHITGEDVLFAGAVVDRLLCKPMCIDNDSSTVYETWIPDDSAVIAQSYWRQQSGQPPEPQTDAAHRNFDETQNPAISCDRFASADSLSIPDAAGLTAALRNTKGGRNLTALGFSDDIELCCRIDSVPALPEYCPFQKHLTIGRSIQTQETE